MSCMPARLLKRAGLAAACAGLLAGCMSSSNPLRAVGAPVLSPREQLEQTAGTSATSQGKLQQGIPLNIGEDTGQQTTAPAQVPAAPQIADSRTGSVEQIRAKAAATGDAPPNVFTARQRATAGMSSAEQEKARAELEAAAARNAAMLGGTDAAARAASAKKLKQQALTHYEETLKEIEN